MTEKEKMLAGELYNAFDKELIEMRSRARKLCQEFNGTDMDDTARRTGIIRSLFASTGDNIEIMSEFHCDYGCNISVGENFFANYGCVILDVCRVEIGDNCLIAPQVGIYTATHPTDASLRKAGLEYGKPIKIGNNCWIGGRAVICPGVTLGDNVVVAAGAVVIDSFPSDVVVGGVPARILRKLEPKK